ncbi:CheY-P-specific phosphatase CheC [Desulfuromonas versatilis]|uniref:CheY-P-specific phosphatase CheC n=1 Tax=Desulfuromonas versatilis TaxID=2802975 RepID=A0ABM8I1W7_9BACT|nr:chemotaxis protein CheC [Desulfuromonas versatilis]BCR06861.1 CheY-P-specific phosphatase CheC [Desulfuromonas versatilis]
MTFTHLTETQLDALKEISNIGMGHAATALSQMIGDTVHLRVPRITVSEIGAVPDLLGGPEKVVVGITLQVLGDARGNILLVFPRESVTLLLSRLVRKEFRESELDELSTSTLKEVGNILSSAYLSALGSLLHMTLIPSIPLLAFDMAGAVVDNILIELSEAGELALIVETDFWGDRPDQEPIKGHFLLLPDPHTLDVILEAVGGEG